MATKLGRKVTCYDGLLPIKSNECGPKRSRDKTLSYFHYHSTYGNQIWKAGEF